MKRYQYGLITVLPPVFILLVCFIVILWKVRDLNSIKRWIAKMAFSDILKEKKKEDGNLEWRFKDINLTCEEEILPRILATFLELFMGILGGTFVMFWQLLLIEMSSDCDVEDPSKDCFEVKFWSWPEQDPIDCNSTAIQTGTTYVECYKIVFNFGVAIGASYGAFKLSMLAFNLGSSVLLMINDENSKILPILRFTVAFLGFLAVLIPGILMATPYGVAFLSTYLATFLQTLIVAYSLVFFLWGIPWNKLIASKAPQDNQNDTGLENPTDDS